ncbi:MAG: hypothetical protein JO192_09330 [Candidatus Eremiobacteraeota bacterium]|nr:hypothetical protein [Candidatus Eremiobacteraeota bacterium]MBV8332922.1 hypothetical protein [Candidatus Eremiobacteraeota bacterium]MBV8721777.1 hypothetical protein [Candidatus Eremiobacteraeota bacterium]
MLVVTAAYVIVLFASVETLKHLSAGPLHYVVALLPLVPVALLVPIVVRYLRETDEFERRLQTESLAIAGGVTAMVAVTYGFLEVGGMPHPSAWWTWCVLTISWAIARPIVGRYYR